MFVSLWSHWNIISLKTNLCTIDSRASSISIKVRWRIQKSVHVLYFLFSSNTWIVVWSQTRFMIWKHNTPRQVTVLIISCRSKLPRRLLEKSGRVHFLHYCCHIRNDLVFVFCLSTYINRHSFLILWFKILFLHELVCHNSIDFFKILQNRQSRLFMFSGHELVDVVVRINSRRSPSSMIKRFMRAWRSSKKISVLVDLTKNRLVETAAWASH